MPTLDFILANIKQEEIGSQIETLRQEVENLRRQIDFQFYAIQALQKICIHPTVETYSVMGKELVKRCTVCGKEL